MGKFDETEILRLAPEILHNDNFDVESASVNDHLLDLHFRIARQPEMFAARIPLVDSTLPMPFLYAVPDDETDFLHMLGIWLEEEAATGCANWGVRALENGVSYFEITNHGFRMIDEVEDARLTASAKGSWDNAHVAEEMRSATD
ncbi:MAG: hypothetical protein QOH69_1497 [Actinomycetota bacterium]|jgi:hypothetical protein|nr:hypothetical protein [Actinomycetota bacterium]